MLMVQVASELEFNDAMIAEREQGIQEVEKAVRVPTPNTRTVYSY